MKLELHFEEFYPHPIDAVWAALIDPVALAQWLMATDFEPQVGKRFTFRDSPTAEFRGWIDCEVLALEPPSRIAWSWQATEDGPMTEVTIELRAGRGWHPVDPDSYRRGRPCAPRAL